MIWEKETKTLQNNSGDSVNNINMSKFNSSFTTYVPLACNPENIRKPEL